MSLVKCPCCNGDGKETCHNPDHGLIGALTWHDVGRLGCPVCGHHEHNKVRGGAPCEECNGSGQVEESAAREFCESMEYDYDDIMDTPALKAPTTPLPGA